MYTLENFSNNALIKCHVYNTMDRFLICPAYFEKEWLLTAKSISFKQASLPSLRN